MFLSLSLKNDRCLNGVWSVELSVCPPRMELHVNIATRTLTVACYGSDECLILFDGKTRLCVADILTKTILAIIVIMTTSPRQTTPISVS